jgi:exosome complex RNA-binding protein Csl4
VTWIQVDNLEMEEDVVTDEEEEDEDDDGMEQEQNYDHHQSGSFSFSMEFLRDVVKRTPHPFFCFSID